MRNGIATAMQKCVLGGQQLFLVPLFIKFWGVDYYGEWLTLSAIPMALAMSDLGLGTAAANAFSLHYAAGDKRAAADVMTTGLWLIALVCLVGVVLGTFSLFAVSSLDWLKGLAIPEPIYIGAIACLGVSRLISFFTGLSEAYFRASRRTHLGIHLSTTYALARLGSGSLVLLTHGNAFHFALADLLISMVSVTTHQLVGRSLLRDLPSGTWLNPGNGLTALLRKSFVYMLNPAWRAISQQGSTLVVRGVLGSEAVALFVTLRTICNFIHQFLTMVNSTLFSELQLALAMRKVATAQKIYLGGMLLSLSVAIGIAIFLALAGPRIYQVWIQDSLSPSPILWAISLASLVVRALWWTAGITFRAVNQPEKVTYVAIIIACVGVGTSWVLAPYWSIAGVAFGQLVMECLMAIYTLPASAKIVGLSMDQFPTSLKMLRLDLAGKFMSAVTFKK